MKNTLNYSVNAICPACGYSIATKIFSDKQPLSTIGWPKDAHQASSMKSLPLDFVRCNDCGHIHNTSFDYKEVPYSKKPNLMFNQGKNWSEFIKKIINEIISKLPENPNIVEIGYGDGSFLSSLQQRIKKGNFYGFDPHGATSNNNKLKLYKKLFHPLEQIPRLLPNLIISRHVLEHMSNPLSFLQSISHSTSLTKINCIAYLEVPCIDNAINYKRTVDFYYEHNSHFTTNSFSKMVSKSNPHSCKIGHGYNREVIYGLIKWGNIDNQELNINESVSFFNSTEKGKNKINKQLDKLIKKGLKLAIWGGVGKSASFINHYKLDNKKFPLVVDSDKDKVGMYVPGMGQEILYRDYLKSNPVEIIIIPPQWRANDILSEIYAENISFDKILIEHEGELIDFINDNHPYKES